MKKLTQSHLNQITGGCGKPSCEKATLAFLDVCTYEEMKKINQIFKSVILSPEMASADDETLRLAMIAAIKADFK